MRWLVATTAGLIGVAALAGWGAIRAYRAPGPLAVPTVLVVSRGTTDEVADALARAGIIRHRLVFRIATYATIAEGPIHAAELSFPARASVATVLNVLRFGRPVQHLVTFPEGVTAAQISDILVRAEGLTGDIAVPPEGAVLPDTYAYTRGTARSAIIARGEQAMRRLLATSWPDRAAGLPLRTPRQALILASIVEREAKLPAERAMIARVFLNRLGMHMKLQADPTALYGASGGAGTLDRALVRADLERADPYNTYTTDALPEGPICSPGAASIAAVLHPAAGDALYFVADGTGGHVFTASLAAHNQNVARYRTERR